MLICIHHVPQDDPRPYSHAFFPRQAFDTVIQRGNWTFGRKGSGYIALYSQHPARWLEQTTVRPREVRFDVVAVLPQPRGAAVVEHIRAAF